jgi:hypothetical protein
MANDTNALRAQIASELNRSLADAFGNSGETFATAVNREINNAIAHYESQPFRWNMAYRSEWATATAFVPAVSLPPDFIEMRRLEIIYTGRYHELEKVTLNEVSRINFAPSMTAYSTALPSKYAIEGNVILLAPPSSATRTLAATYTKRYLPTSITDSTTTKHVFAGSLTMTVTTTTSHKNRTNGWTTDGAALIRARAKASILINYSKDGDAIQEMAIIAQRGESFLCAMEAFAYKALADKTFDAYAIGKIRGYGL